MEKAMRAIIEAYGDCKNERARKKLQQVEWLMQDAIDLNNGVE